MSDNSPIVIDNRPDYIRAGLSSGDKPTVVFPTNSVTSKAPMGDDGVVTDWDDMKALWTHTFQQMGVDPSQHSILITDPPFNRKTCREKTAQIFFDTFNVPKFYIIMGEILALYDAKKLTAVAVSLRANGRSVVTVPCYNGYPFPSAIRFDNLDPNTLTDQDISKINKMIYQSVFNCDSDVRGTLWSNIVLTGSTSVFPGLATKIQKGVSDSVPAAIGSIVKVFEPSEPENGAWRGGDKFVPLLDEYGSWVSKQEYQQYGATIVHRKCPF